MARVSWDIVRGIADREGLDHLCVRSTDKKSLYYQCEGEVLAGIDEVRSQIDGEVLVEAWKGTSRKDGYAWTVGTPSRVAVNGTANGGGPSWPEYIDLKVQHETLKLRNELEPRDTDMGELFGLLKSYAPAIAAHYGVKAPQVVNAAPGAAVEVDESALPKDELASMLREVAIFAKRDPEAARAYMDLLRKQNGTSNG